MKLSGSDRIGLVKPHLDAHTLGLASVERILNDCRIRVTVQDAEISEAVSDPLREENGRRLRRWIEGNGLTALGFSYRLDPGDGERLFAVFVDFLKRSDLLASGGGTITALFFAGLPEACDRVLERFPFVSGVFRGDETPGETLDAFGIPRNLYPEDLVRGAGYDEARLAFGRELIRKADYLSVKPVDRGGYPSFGRRGDTVTARIADGLRRGLPPLMRAHVGPYLPHRTEAVGLFIDWAKRLARSGYLDVLSIGTSQLSQSAFGETWEGRPDGGGVPVNSPGEFSRIWEAARPMLVRTYAGTGNIPEMARMYEERLDIAWHALSFWWFCRIDGRGSNGVLENLREHAETLRFIAATGKPFEPNVPHHFAFRGADDVTYVVSGVLAARAAKKAGIRSLILQTMLNTPRYTWGVQDLAKARALLRLVRELEDGTFRAYLQPRGGLDYFSHDIEKAKAQLAAVTALMDDIEPHDPSSPAIVHVVSYSEAVRLADPEVIDESIMITRHALSEYRRLRRAGSIDDMSADPEVLSRTDELLAQARAVLATVDEVIPEPYSPEGLHEIFAAGFLPVPYLAECRDEYPLAVRWKTALVRGSVQVVDENSVPTDVGERLELVKAGLRTRSARSVPRTETGA